MQPPPNYPAGTYNPWHWQSYHSTNGEVAHLNRHSAWERAKAEGVEFRFPPGTFDYSGFGMGNYYGKDGKPVWCSTSEAYQKAREEGLTCKMHDELEFYHPVALGDH